MGGNGRSRPETEGRVFNPSPHHIEACRKLRILVVGDVMLDHYLRGTIERTSPEAPVGVLSVESEDYLLGGAGNVARNLAAMGARVELAGVAGADANRQILLELLEKANVRHKGLLVDNDRPTIVKTRAVAQGQQVLRIDHELRIPLSPALETRLLKRIVTLVGSCDGVLVSDYGKGVVTSRVLRGLVATCRKHKRPIIADPKGLDYRRYRGIDILTPNQKEAQTASGVEITDDSSLVRAGAALNRYVGGKGICITRGAKGVAVIPLRGRPLFIPPHPREVYDVTGAGDTFVSHLALGIFQGLRIGEAAAWANLAAGIVVERLGVAVVTPRELLGELHGDRQWSKYCTIEELRPIVRALRAARKKIVFTNGCFDLLHVGHIRLLESARALGDCLIVALNSDASVRAVKGPPRPLLPENERVALLAALHSVDYILVFDSRSPEALIRAIRPDVLVKGGNLEPEEVVGRRIVESYGGTVHLAPMFGDRSITQFLTRLSSSEAALGSRRTSKLSAKPGRVRPRGARRRRS